MALNLSNINYGGKELADSIVRDFFSSNTLHQAFGARIIPGLKGKAVWHDAKISGTIVSAVPGQASTCPAFDSDFTVGQNTTTLCEYTASGKIPHASLVSTYREMNYVDGVLNESVIDDAEIWAVIKAMITDFANETQGDNFLNQDAAYSACEDGLLLQFEDNTLGRPVPSGQRVGATTISAANVQAEMSKVIHALPSKYRYGKLAQGLSKPKFAVSGNIMDFYQQSLTFTAPTGSAGAQGPNVTVGDINSYRGYELIVIDALGTNEMFFTAPDNIGIVFDAEDDIMNLLVRNATEDSNLCTEIRWRLDWRAGIMFGDGTKVVWYR